MTTRTYPHYGTCDGCAQGAALREFDPVSQAWICEDCDTREDDALITAANVTGHPLAVVRAVVDAYHQAHFEAADQ